MMAALARFVLWRPRAILAVAVVVLAGAAVWSSGLSDRLSTGGNEVPGSDSVQAASLLAESDLAGSPNLVVLIAEEPRLGPSAEAAAGRVVTELQLLDGVEVQVTAWTQPELGDRLRSDDGAAGLIVAHLTGTDADVQETSVAVMSLLRGRDWPGAVTVEVGGVGPTRADIINTTDRDLIRAELLALPLCFLLLLFVFRTPVAAALPLVVAATGVLGTMAVLRVLVEFVEVSIFARSVATALGLAMAVDMTLLLVGRYREGLEDRHGEPTAAERRAAVGRAVRGAGPAILLSGLTTAATLSTLLAFSTPLLRSFAYAGSVVVLLSLVGSLIVLPATLICLGSAVEALPVRRPVRGRSEAWARLTRAVMRRPLVVGGAALILLLAVASPILRIELGLNDDRVLPSSVESRRVADEIRERFPGLEGGAISVVPVDPPDPAIGDQLDDYAAALDGLPGVARVEDDGRSLTVVPTVEPISDDGRTLVEAIRAVPSPVPVVVGGEAARFVDNTNHVIGRLPWVVALVLVMNAVLLAGLLRSVVAPIKALVLNLLSLSAMFGAIVWIFQDGRLTGLLGYTPTGLTDVTVPLLMFAVAFGLSMDYEVYLLARMRERFVISGDAGEATVDGMARTGRILTASALLMSVVFLSFATSSVTHLKILGLGITLAVLVDAFVVRTLLVPSFMAFVGSLNWWPSTGPVTEPTAGPERWDDGGRRNGRARTHQRSSARITKVR